MSAADYYPAGAYRDPSAPFNQSDPEEKEFSVLCSQTLSKSATVLTDDYTPGDSGVDYEPDGEGGYYSSAWQDPDDTSDTNWEAAYHDNDHYTPLELINEFKECLIKQWNILKDAEEANDAGIKQEKRKIKHLIEECSNWTEDEVEYLEDN